MTKISELSSLPPVATGRTQQTGTPPAGEAVTEKQRQQAKKIGRDFEALFVGMMLKSMRETVGKDKLTGGGHGEEIYQSFLDQEYAAAVSRRGGMGLAPLIERDILRSESRAAYRNAGAAAGLKKDQEK